jgi:ABC-2 type transport system ATP-binding protein
VFISSHDLSEIESFASHVGYLERGRLQFSEEMASLSQRFREIEVTLQGTPVLPAPWPPAWINVERAAAVVRFVDTQFELERTLAEVHRVFEQPHQVTVNAMPLRSIFVTLAKAGRKAA